MLYVFLDTSDVRYQSYICQCKKDAELLLTLIMNFNQLFKFLNITFANFNMLLNT